MKIYFATKNPHKVKEVSMIAPKGIELMPLPPSIPDAPEKGSSFLENALFKALWYMEHLGQAVVADDSGLEIDYLEGFPGINSSRFMQGRDYREKMEVILRMLEGAPSRSARFVCQAVFVSPDGTVLGANGVVEGRIAQSIRGDKGFGYDPIFVPEGHDKTFGELGESVKSQISHRSRAFRELFRMMEIVLQLKGRE